MQLIRAVFDAPKDCSDYILKQEFKTAARKFVDHFEAEGWVLKSSLGCYMDAGRSRKDLLKNHYVITGYFYPLNKKEDKKGELILPKSIVDRLKQKMPEKVKVLSERV